jgi:hypothetical protein
LKTERARFDRQLSQMTEAELTARSAPEAWSIKDSLAHLVHWEQYMLERVRRAVDQGEAPQRMADEEEKRLIENAENAEVFEDNKDRPLADILHAMRRSYEQIVAQVEALPESDLIDPRRFAWLNGDPLWKYIANESYAEHYHEHLHF